MPFALPSSSLLFLGHLYATVGLAGSSSFRKSDDNKVSQCVCIILVMFGMPVP